MKALLTRSPIGTSPDRTLSASFSTGTDSPVRAASSMRRLALSVRRTSAGT